MKKLIAAFAGMIVCGLMAAPASAQIMGMNGKWSLNHEKSQGPLNAKEILTYEVTPTQEHYIVDEVEFDGRKFNSEYTAKFDGKEYPNKNLVTGEVRYVKVEKVFPRVEYVTNIVHVPGPNGKTVSKVRGHYIRLLSLDGKTYTSTLINADGKVTAVRVFDKIE